MSAHCDRHVQWNVWLHTVVSTPEMWWSSRSRHTGQCGSSVCPAERLRLVLLLCSCSPSVSSSTASTNRMVHTSGSMLLNCACPHAQRV